MVRNKSPICVVVVDVASSTSSSLAAPPPPIPPIVVVSEFAPGYVAGVGDPVRAVTGAVDADLVTYLPPSSFVNGAWLSDKRLLMMMHCRAIVADICLLRHVDAAERWHECSDRGAQMLLLVCI